MQLKTAVLNYLTAGSDVPNVHERNLALADLTERCVWQCSDDTLREQIILYVNDNPREFCVEGMDAALVAVGIAKPVRGGSFTVVLDIDVDSYLDVRDDDDDTVEAYDGPTPHSLLEVICHAVENRTCGIRLTGRRIELA